MRSAMLKAKMKQKDLIAATGYSQATLSRLEAGKSPTLEQARAVAAALKTTIQMVFPETP